MKSTSTITILAAIATTSVFVEAGTNKTLAPTGGVIRESPAPSTPFPTVTRESPAPSTPFPTEGPCEFVFDGIDDAISLFQGAISIIWDFPHYVNGDIVDLESVRYHILSYAGTFDFKSVLENSNHTAETLISEFEVNSVNETSGIQYHLVDDGEVFKFDLNTTFYGEAHALLVIAEVDGVLSRNGVQQNF